MICFDIETISDLEKLAVIPAPEIKYGNTKDEQKRKELEDQARSKQIERLGLSPWTGRVCAWAVCGDVTDMNHLIEPTDQDEIALLASLFPHITKAMMQNQEIVTFNGNQFDFPYLYGRAASLGMNPPLYPLGTFTKRYRLQPHFDVRMALTGWDQRAEGTLDYFGKVLLGQSKEELDYREFLSMIQDGRGQEIARNCLQHAELTRDLYERIGPYYMPTEQHDPNPSHY